MTLTKGERVVRLKLDLDDITDSILKDVIELKRAIKKGGTAERRKRINRNVLQISVNLDNMVRVKKGLDGLRSSTHKRKR